MARPAVQTRIEGLRELNRALNKVNRGAAKEVRDALKEAGDPVRSRAEALAAQEIRKIGPVWSRMKIGSTSKGVFLRPGARRAGGSPRPNLGGLLMTVAMWPAAEQGRPDVEEAIEDALERLGNSAGF